MSIHPAILYHLHKQSDFDTTCIDENVSSYINDDFWIYESKEAYIESLTRDAMLRHVEKKRREVLYSIENNFIIPMPVPDDVKPCEPPAKASLVLSRFLKTNDREAVLGDLTEQYGQKVEQRGKRHADFWFYREVARSLWPLAKHASGKMIKLAISVVQVRKLTH